MNPENANLTPVYIAPLSPIGAHQSVTLPAASYSPYGVPGDAKYMLVQAITANVRFTLDGTVPTASVGFQLVASDPPLLIPLSPDTKPNFIREATGAILQFIWMG